MSCRVAWEILKGNEIKEGMDLGKPGYDNILLENQFGIQLFMVKPGDVTAENVDEWVERGL